MRALVILVSCALLVAVFATHAFAGECSSCQRAAVQAFRLEAPPATASASASASVSADAQAAQQLELSQPVVLQLAQPRERLLRRLFQRRAVSRSRSVAVTRSRIQSQGW